MSEVRKFHREETEVARTPWETQVWWRKDD